MLGIPVSTPEDKSERSAVADKFLVENHPVMKEAGANVTSDVLTVRRVTVRSNSPKKETDRPGMLKGSTT